MTDRQTSAILIGVAVVWFLLWYRKRSEEERSTLFGVGEPGTTASQGAKAVGRAAGSTGKPLGDLLAFAGAHGLRVTSPVWTGTKWDQGKHNENSPHYENRAIDVSARGLTDRMISDMKKFAEMVGIKVVDERSRPKNQKVWTGPHFHLQVPR